LMSKLFILSDREYKYESNGIKNSFWPKMRVTIVVN